MDWKQITALVTGVVIAALLLTTIVVPIIGETTTTERTLANDGLYHMTKYDATAEFTAEWEYANPNQITIDETIVTLPESATYLMSVIGDDGFFVRYGALTAGNYGVQVYDSTTINLRAQASTGNTSNMTIAVSDGTITFTVGTTSISETITGDFFFVSNDGEYIMKKASETAYVNGDSDFYGIGRSTYNTSDGATVDNFYITGTIDDGITVESMTSAEITISNETINATALNGYANTYSLSGFSFDITANDMDSAVSYTQIIVPATISAELSEHLDNSSISLLSIVPLLITVGIIMAVVGLFVMRRE